MSFSFNSIWIQITKKHQSGSAGCSLQPSKGNAGLALFSKQLGNIYSYFKTVGDLCSCTSKVSDLSQLYAFSWKSWETTISSGMSWEIHKRSANIWWVTGNIEGGYTWLPKHFNRKQILQTEIKAVE